MKRIIVVAVYEAYVPDDMKVSQVNNLCEKEINDQLQDFRIYVEDYEDNGENEPWFNLQSVSVGTNSSIAVGKDKDD